MVCLSNTILVGVVGKPTCVECVNHIFSVEYRHNIYLDALPSPDAISLSNRELTAARQSRHRLYTESHRLYRLYEDLLNERFKRQAVRDLLAETLVIPTKDYKLFELFCVFGVIRRLQDHYPELELQPITRGMDTIARLEGCSRRLEIYYDQNGPLTFFEAYPSKDDLANLDVPEPVVRHVDALETHQRALDQFLSRDSQPHFYSGRPDFLVLIYETGQQTGERDSELTDVLLGEVKYTRSKSTFAQGLRELLEYRHFARENDYYLFGDNAVDCDVSCLLCTDSVDTDTCSSEGITHINTTEFVELKENTHS